MVRKLFSPDGKQIALTTKTGEDVYYNRTVTICRCVQSTTKNHNFYAAGISSGAALCVFVRWHDLRGPHSHISQRKRLGRQHFCAAVLRCQNRSGIISSAGSKKGGEFVPIVLSSDGDTLAAVIWKPNESPGNCCLLGWEVSNSQIIELGQHVGVGGLAFDPNGKWLAAIVQIGTS